MSYVVLYLSLWFFTGEKVERLTSAKRLGLHIKWLWRLPSIQLLIHLFLNFFPYLGWSGVKHNLADVS